MHCFAKTANHSNYPKSLAARAATLLRLCNTMRSAVKTEMTTFMATEVPIKDDTGRLTTTANYTWCQKWLRFMMAGFSVPSMKWESDNLPQEFASFSQYCELVFDGPYSSKSEKEQCSYLLLWIGRPGVDIYNSGCSKTKMINSRELSSFCISQSICSGKSTRGWPVSSYNYVKMWERARMIFSAAAGTWL